MRGCSLSTPETREIQVRGSPLSEVERMFLPYPREMGDPNAEGISPLRQRTFLLSIKGETPTLTGSPLSEAERMLLLHPRHGRSQHSVDSLSLEWRTWFLSVPSSRAWSKLLQIRKCLWDLVVVPVVCSYLWNFTTWMFVNWGLTVLGFPLDHIDLLWRALASVQIHVENTIYSGILVYKYLGTRISQVFNLVCECLGNDSSRHPMYENKLYEFTLFLMGKPAL